MKNIIKKIKMFSLLMVSLLVITSCEDNEDGVTNPGFSEDLTARFTSVQEGKTISFINISENATSYRWDFGDGTSSTLNNPEKRYTNGTYTVTLTAFDKAGRTSTATDSYIIEGCADETEENLDPANGDLNWTFLNANGNAGFSAFGDIGGGIVNNPVLDNVNSSCNVFLYDKLSGCQSWSGAGYGLNTGLNFSTMENKIFKIKVLAENQVATVTLLLEVGPGQGPSLVRQATITEVGKWEELSFDFSDVNTNTLFKNFVIYFERGAACDGDVYYFDDITQTQ